MYQEEKKYFYFHSAQNITLYLLNVSIDTLRIYTHPHACPHTCTPQRPSMIPSHMPRYSLIVFLQNKQLYHGLKKKRKKNKKKNLLGNNYVLVNID